tara:strand:- start:848 stop:1276 length:429 start_codon:yes stop_codon:yes gene_type:complete
MKKLLTAGLVVVLSMFLATTVVAQKESARKGYKGHKKQEHIAKRTSEKGCPKCVALRKEVVALRKRLAATSKGKGKTKGHGRTPRRGRTEGRRTEGRRTEGHRGSRGERWGGGRPDSKKATPSKERMDRLRTLLEKRRNRAS